jgi:hypothetical protein
VYRARRCGIASSDGCESGEGAIGRVVVGSSGRVRCSLEEERGGVLACFENVVCLLWFAVYLAATR